MRQSRERWPGCPRPAAGPAAAGSGPPWRVGCRHQPAAASTRPSATAADEGSVIALVLVGVGHGEAAHGPIEGVTAPEVRGDDDGVARPGVGPGQHGAAGHGELPQPGRDGVGIGDHLHVAELAHVDVPALDVGPTGEDVTGALHQLAAHDDPLAVVGVCARTEVGLVHRGPGFLELEEEGVVAVATLAQDEEDLHAHAADAHHLPGHVRHREAVEQVPAVLREGGRGRPPRWRRPRPARPGRRP